MKKFLFLGGLSIALSGVMMADEGENGIFIGFDTGYGVGFEETIQTQQGQQTEVRNTTSAPSFIAFGVKAGYSYYFLSFLGVRGYLDYQYGFSVNSTTTTQQGQAAQTDVTRGSVHQVALNADVLLNFINAESFKLGVYAGIGLGFASANNTQVTQVETITRKLGEGFILPINVGFGIIAGTHHRLDFGVKIPTLGIKAVTNQQNQNETTTYRDLMVTIGYSYQF